MIINKVNDIRHEFMEKWHNADFVTDKSGVKTIEIVNASFIADEDAIFGTPNKEYIEREIEWYLSQSLSVHDLQPTPKIWEDISDALGNIHSNYGYLVFSKENYNQYYFALQELQKNQNSRRAIMIYTRPQIQSEYRAAGMSDFICTNAVQYLIRDNKLHAVVQMRSNDVVFGYRNDYAWQQYVLDRLACDLKIDIGDIHWNVGSLHVYERHFKFVKDAIVEYMKKEAADVHTAKVKTGLEYTQKVMEFYD